MQCLSYLFQTGWKQASKLTLLQQITQLPDTQQGLPACLFIFYSLKWNIDDSSNALHKPGVGYVPLSVTERDCCSQGKTFEPDRFLTLLRPAIVKTLQGHNTLPPISFCS